MNKSQLSNTVAVVLGVSKSSGAATVDLVLEAIGGVLATGEDVTLHEFGTFRLIHRAAEPARAINGKTYAIPARTKVRFKAHAGLLARLPAPVPDPAA
ncbi:HU family DNA-binding protein [Candidatus Thiodictyon syntrophicum]|uniref:HU family DNA-binding protein n=1 Tax=Candidatus Thiodictyon syntrophicum TaxID=1166950 RepID=UPI0012FD5504|nr:HU family DNA-binding protein [Candidatus Thiodictyon syntrophicum]